MSKDQYIIFGRDGCGYCEKAKILCFDRELEFEYHNLANRVEVEVMNSLFSDLGIVDVPTSVPQIFRFAATVGTFTHVGGYDDLNTLLGGAE